MAVAEAMKELGYYRRGEKHMSMQPDRAFGNQNVFSCLGTLQHVE